MNAVKNLNRTVPFHWAGGKQWMASIIERYLPQDINRLLIPFVGRYDFGRILRGLGLEAAAIVSDIHPKLIAAHEGIKEDPSAVIRLLKEHQALHSPEHFLEVRNSFDLNNPKIQSAADFIYLMNGSYKACLKERINGEHTNVSARRTVSCQSAAIYAHAVALRNTTLVVEDFAATMMRAGRNDFMPIDPPYLDCMGYGGLRFTAYDHMRLETLCREAHAAGALFLLTSSDHPFIRRLYRGFAIETVEVPRGLGAKRTAMELIITNY